jgi:hypothetical protein
MQIQNPVLIARDAIYKLLLACGWTIPNQKIFHLAAGTQLLLLNNDSLPFVYASTGKISCYILYKDSKRCSGNGFTFHQRERMKEGRTLLARLRDILSLAFEGVHIIWFTLAINELCKMTEATLHHSSIQENVTP